MKMPKAMTHRGYTGSVEVSLEDDCLHGRLLYVTDLITYEGDTVAKLRAEFTAAVDRYLNHCAAVGKDPDQPCSGTFNVRIGPDLHRQAAIAAASESRSLNDFVVSAIQAAVEPALPEKVVHEHHFMFDDQPVIENVTASSSQDSVIWRGYARH